jgi:outer membrane receptor protein involved in Fe transport
MKRITTLVPLGLALTLTGFPAYSAEDAEEGGKYIEEIIVTGERGDTSTLDRAMTVTGFNGIMIEKLGIQNMDDLETLVPGLQKGTRSTAGKNEDGHLVMRGVANDRRINFFQDSSVAVYVDGIYNPMSYGLDAGMFDIERIEVARGPQGTTGGKAAMAGTLSFVSKKPTDVWDVKASAEFTDQASQQFDLAFGGPIGDTPFSYRFAVNSLTGDGLIKNVGSGPDAGEPDRLQYSPQIRFKTDRWDITGRYKKLEDTGVQRISLAIGARNSEEEFVLNADGTRRCEIDRVPGSPTEGGCIEDSNGNIVYITNPNFGLGQSPAIRNCKGFNNDGTRDPGLPVVCEGEDLSLLTELNAPIGQNNSQETYSLEAKFALNDAHDIIYLFGDRDTRTDEDQDQDLTNRQPGGVCSAIHPRVISGELQEGQTHPRCALDGAGNGVYSDGITNYLRTSDQQSHEITLVSNNDGKLNYTVGYTYLAGDEPYVFRSIFNGVETGNSNLNNPTFYTDTTARCEAEFAGNNMADVLDPNSDSHFLSTIWNTGCYGSELTAYHSDVTNGGTHVNGSGVASGFYGNVEYEQQAVYGNVEYVLNDEWKVFGGIRYNDDHKEHNQNDFTSAAQATLADGTVVNIVNGIFRSKHQQTTCCGYVGLYTDANGNTIPDNRTLVDSKVKTWKETTWNIGFEYAPSDSYMWYGRVSRGYRAGGFAGFGNQLGEAFEPETMLNYEGGLKGLFLDNTVQLEIGLYFQDFDAFWIQSQRLRTAEELVINNDNFSAFIGETNAISGTEIAGIEAQGAWQISDRLVLRGFYEYMYSSFGEFSTNYCCNPQGENFDPVLQTLPGPDGSPVINPTTGEPQLFNITGLTSFKGNQLRMQPEHKLSATLSYEVPIKAEWGSLDVVTIMSWRDEMYPDEGNFDIYAIPDYTRWDFRSNWTSPSGTYSASFWVTNLLDVVQVQSYSPRDGNGVTAAVQGTVTDERRVGLTFNYQL